MNLVQRITTAARFVVRGPGPQARYEGARRTPMRSNIPAVVQSARWDITHAARYEILRKSRYFEKNNGLCNRLADLFEQYTVGQGLRILPDSSDAAWNLAALAEWESWGRFADLCSRQSWATLQGVIARTLFVDGEIFILLTAGTGGFPRVQLIEGHRVRTPPNMTEGKGIVDGVEIDGNGRPIAYYIAKDDVAYSNEFVRQPADFVVHVFEPGRASQYRGLPMLYPVLNQLHDLDDLEVLEMQAAKDQAKTTKVIKTKEGELPGDEDLIRGTTIGTDGTERADYYQDVFSGSAAVLRPGDEFQQFPGERPSAATSGYWDRLERNVCAGVGIPRELVIPQSMQGTSIRSVLDISNAFFRSRSSVLADHFARVYAYVIESGMSARRIPQGPPDWYRTTHRAPRSINVDVGRNSAAAISEWKTGMRTMRDTYAETGDDWAQQLEQKAREAKAVNDLAKKYGVDRAEIVMLDPNELSSANAAATA